MFAFLLILFFAQVCVYFHRQSGARNIRDSVLRSLLVLASSIAVLTEGLSFFSALEARTVTLVWIVANLGFCICLIHKFGPSYWIAALYRQNLDPSRLLAFRETRIYLLIGGVLYSVVFAIALYAPPNTIDSMTYHMARVAHWVQQGSVDHYPTTILRQLYQNPFAEYAILHLQLLSGSDRYANLVQFTAFVGCGVAVSLICRELGLGPKMQALAVVLVVTIPMALLQGASTQNDLVVSLFTLCFFYFFHSFAVKSRLSDCIFGGLSLGVALLSKGTAFPFCFAIGLVIFAVYFFVKQSSAERIRFAFRTFLMTTIALVIFAPVLARNFKTFGSPLTTGEDKVANEHLSPAIAASNLYRNYATHLGTLFASTNSFIKETGQRIFRDELNNPDSTYLSIDFGVDFSFHEDVAGNLLHISLITLCLPIAFFGRRSTEKKLLAINALVVVLGFFIFCLVLRWQPWASRLHTPLFLLSMPMVAAGLARLGTRATAFATLLCVIGALPFLMAGEPRSIFSSSSVFTTDRQDQYFANKRDLGEVYRQAAQILREREASEVGLFLSNENKFYDFGDWDYAVWISLKDNFAEGPEIRYVGVENVSAKLGERRAAPEWVLATKSGNDIDGAHYTETWKNGIVRLLHRSDME